MHHDQTEKKELLTDLTKAKKGQVSKSKHKSPHDVKVILIKKNEPNMRLMAKAFTLLYESTLAEERN
ncbi:hypothetical protein ABET51_06805 [Metabacillus fastidiosus]|uniref:hypothetical protein n=1 Tax=Metabacillus fastidiosus TaxID=1458 RepID=UPI003D2816AA